MAHHGQLYQVRTNVRATHVKVEDRVDGTMRMTHKGRPLTYQAIVARPLRVPPPPTIARPQRLVAPTRAHPWRKRLLPEGTRHAAARDTTVKEDLLKGKKVGDMTYKVHLDGYNLLPVLKGEGEFPPRQKPGSFNLDRVMEAMTKPQGGGK